MDRFSNVAISIIFALVLMGPALVFASEAAHLDLPSWATAEDARWLSGGVEESNVMKFLSLPGVESRELQGALSDELDKRIPFKAALMLGNAALQRSLIASANTICGWDCYPTYYGSNRVYIPSQDAVSYFPWKYDEAQNESLRGFGEGVASVAKRHPEVRLCVCAVQGYSDPSVNPAYELVSNSRLPSEQIEALRAGIGDAANAFLVSEGYSSLEEYYHDFFKTDHHWNYLGVERAYRSISSALNLNALESTGEVGFGDYRYTGATARWGLDPLSEEVFASNISFDELELHKPDGSVSSYDHNAFYDRTDPGKKHGFYDSYYDCIPSGTTICGPGERKALIICNSYGAGIAPYIAMGYKETAYLGDLHPLQRSQDARLEQLIVEGGYDDVYIIANPSELAGFLDDCPNYFDDVLGR